jgi:erythromycin esterase-like protein
MSIVFATLETLLILTFVAFLWVAIWVYKSSRQMVTAVKGHVGRFGPTVDRAKAITTTGQSHGRTLIKQTRSIGESIGRGASSVRSAGANIASTFKDIDMHEARRTAATATTVAKALSKNAGFVINLARTLTRR